MVLFAEGTTGDGNAPVAVPLRPGRRRPRRPCRPRSGAGGVRLQPLAITYPRRNGLPVTRSDRSEIAWYGDMDLAPHVADFVQGGPIDVHVVWGSPIVFEANTDRKAATAAAEAEVRAALQGLVAGAAALHRTRARLPAPNRGPRDSTLAGLPAPASRSRHPVRLRCICRQILGHAVLGHRLLGHLVLGHRLLAICRCTTRRRRSAAETEASDGCAGLQQTPRCAAARCFDAGAPGLLGRTTPVAEAVSPPFRAPMPADEHSARVRVRVRSDRPSVQWASEYMMQRIEQAEPLC